MAPMYYVYELIDPRDGAVFYVGKGQGNRVSQHVRDAISGRICNQAQHDLILNLIDARYLPIENIVAQFSEEDEAALRQAYIEMMRNKVKSAIMVELVGGERADSISRRRAEDMRLPYAPGITGANVPIKYR